MMTSAQQQEFILRPPTLDDLPAVVEMLNTGWLETIGTQPFHVDTMRTDWEEPRFDYNKDVGLSSRRERRGGRLCCRLPRHPMYAIISFLVPTLHRADEESALRSRSGARAALPRSYRLRRRLQARVAIGCSTVNSHQAGAELLRELDYRIYSAVAMR